VRRSEINQLVEDAFDCFRAHGWALPPSPRWDVTDFGLGDWQRYGLVLVNLAEHEEYCEKLMYAKRGMTTPAHCHAKKKEDIICRWGELRVQVWGDRPEPGNYAGLDVMINGEHRVLLSWDEVVLKSGERITLFPGVWHEFAPESDECIVGEVSTANDDLNDNFFANDEVGRFPNLEEDEPPLVRLVSDR